MQIVRHDLAAMRSRQRFGPRFAHFIGPELGDGRQLGSGSAFFRVAAGFDGVLFFAAGGHRAPELSGIRRTRHGLSLLKDLK